MRTSKNNNMNEAAQTLLEVMIGIVVVSILECFVGIFIAHDYRYYLFGTLLGAGSAAFFYFHLFYVLDKALDKPEKEAVKYSKIQTVIRMVLMGTVIVVAFTFYENVSVVMTFVGMMNVKFAAYLQPTTHRCINLIKKGR